jgi:hypothetical protein
MPIAPKPEQLAELMERAPDGKLYMLNLLKFKDKAEYADGREPRAKPIRPSTCTGRRGSPISC